ncbi:MAG: tetratricopeptide repeat protein [Saprospiraceae bacterium]|nr:tetratricopeptide repeat protein [Saprospiraceae bacterium]
MLNELERCLLSFLIVLCLIITNSIYCPSQNYNKRHLLDSLHTTTNPKIRVRLLWNLADEVQRYNTDSALIVGHQALTIGRSINDMEGISRSLGIIGSVYSRMNNFPKSLQYFFNKRQIDEKSGNVHNLASTLINIGVVYSLQTDFKEALIFFEKADSISRINKLTDMYHHLNINLGNVYEKLKQPDKAVLFYNKALDDALASNDSFNMSISYIGLGNVFSMKGDEYKALNYYNTAIPVIKESKDMELYSEHFPPHIGWHKS